MMRAQLASLQTPAQRQQAPAPGTSACATAPALSQPNGHVDWTLTSPWTSSSSQPAPPRVPLMPSTIPTDHVHGYGHHYATTSAQQIAAGQAPSYAAQVRGIPKDMSSFKYGDESPLNFINRIKLQLQSEETDPSLWVTAMLKSCFRDRVPAEWISARLIARKEAIMSHAQEQQRANQSQMRAHELALNCNSPGAQGRFDLQSPRAAWLSPLQPDHLAFALQTFQDFIKEFTTPDLTNRAQKAFDDLKLKEGQSMREYILKISDHATLLQKDLNNTDTKRSLIQSKFPVKLQESLAYAYISPDTHTWEQICTHFITVDAHLPTSGPNTSAARSSYNYNKPQDRDQGSGYNSAPPVNQPYRRDRVEQRENGYTNREQTTHRDRDSRNPSAPSVKPRVVRDATELARRKLENCRFFVTNGHCRNGNTCDYRHPTSSVNTNNSTAEKPDTNTTNQKRNLRSNNINTGTEAEPNPDNKKPRTDRE